MSVQKIMAVQAAKGRLFPIKKKTLSNKALTKRVRSLSNQEGERTVTSAMFTQATTHTAGTAIVVYMDDVGLFLSTDTITQHNYECTLKLISTVKSTIRLIYLFDEKWDGVNLTAAEILDSPADSSSPYLSGVVANMAESKNKNRHTDYRAVIVRDMIFSKNAAEPKTVKFKLPLFNRKTKLLGAQNTVKFFPLILLLADEGDCVISLGVDYSKTILAN